MSTKRKKEINNKVYKLLKEAGAKELTTFEHKFYGLCARLVTHSSGKADIQLVGDGPYRFRMDKHRTSVWYKIHIDKFINQYIKNIWPETKMVSAEDNFKWCKEGIFDTYDEFPKNGHMLISGGLTKDQYPEEWLIKRVGGYGIDAKEEKPILPTTLWVEYGDPEDAEALVPKGIVNYRIVTMHPHKEENRWVVGYATKPYTGKFSKMIKTKISTTNGLENMVYSGKVHKLTHHNAIEAFNEGPDGFYSAVNNLIKEKVAAFTEKKKKITN